VHTLEVFFLFRALTMQLIASSLFQDAAPVASPIIERSFPEKVAEAIAVIKSLILAGKRFVVATSFGKDSSVTLAIALKAMEQLKAEGLEVPELHVLNSDTLIENPRVHSYSKDEIRTLKAYSEKNGLPVRIWVCSPNLSENWLVSIIGGRTVASLPGNSAKCQQQIKASPMDRTKRQIKAVIQQEMGSDFASDTIITLIGTRRDESAVRGRNMAARGESAFLPVNMAKPGEKDNWILSPIADFTTMDIFTFLAEVTNGRLDTYSDFTQLTEIYRDSAGDCMVNVMIRDGGAERKTSCGARHGCWMCLRVSTDKSMENMLSQEDGRHEWMKPLNDFRNYLKARHYDPKGRNWLARTINPENGYIKISANAYSPELCLELLRYALTIDADEAEWSQRNRQPARFQLLGMKEVLAIDLHWSRYSYQRPFTALSEYKAIFENGKRYPLPAEYAEFQRSDLDISRSIEVPFADAEFNGMFEGLRSVNDELSCQGTLQKKGIYYTNVNETNEFDLDDEGVELFYAFELDRALEYYGPHQDVYPSQALHYLLRYGVVSFKKGGHSAWDRMLRIGNQLHRHGLREILNDPDALVAKLTGLFVSAASPQQASRGQNRSAPRCDNGQYLMDF
jgi:3'-phosphoadenosine 5'-phosphosulfate sulfotransferase (PAPS reductase)/FAD synthetase